jgi:hypothetical protein
MSNPQKTDVRALLRASTPDACRVLCDTILDTSAKPELRVKCCEIVLDRVCGKAPQDAETPPAVVFMDGERVGD